MTDQTSNGRLSPELQEISTKLIKLAAELVRGEVMPDTDSILQCKTTPRTDWVRVSRALDGIQDRLRLYGIRLKEIADKLPRQEPVETTALAAAVRELLASECSVSAPYCGNAMDPVNDLRLVSGRRLEKVRAALGSPEEPSDDDARDAARYRVVRLSKLTGDVLGHELDAACDAFIAARSAKETNAPPSTDVWECPCCGSWYKGERLVCPVSGDPRPKPPEKANAPLAGCRNWKPKHGVGPYCGNCGFHENEHQDIGR